MRNKREQIKYILASYYGIGVTRAQLIYTICGYHSNERLRNKKYYNLTIQRLRLYVFMRKWVLDNQLRAARRQKFVLYRLLYSFYKYYRLKYGLPLRGQRTRSNRHTSRLFKSFNRYLDLDFDEIKRKRKQMRAKKRIRAKSTKLSSLAKHLRVKKYYKKYLKF